MGTWEGGRWSTLEGRGEWMEHLGEDGVNGVPWKGKGVGGGGSEWEYLGRE